MRNAARRRARYRDPRSKSNYSVNDSWSSSRVMPDFKALKGSCNSRLRRRMMRFSSIMLFQGMFGVGVALRCQVIVYTKSEAASLAKPTHLAWGRNWARRKIPEVAVCMDWPSLRSKRRSLCDRRRSGSGYPTAPDWHAAMGCRLWRRIWWGSGRVRLSTGDRPFRCVWWTWFRDTTTDLLGSRILSWEVWRMEIGNWCADEAAYLKFYQLHRYFQHTFSAFGNFAWLEANFALWKITGKNDKWEINHWL